VAEPSSFVIILTTFPAGDDPEALASALVEERLAACVNVLPPMRSIYRWQDNVERAMEHQLVIKTRSDRVDAVKSRLASVHPYDVPEVLILAVAGGSDAYLQWLHASA
jgi:periplasmic divalent cation tolerance protein